MHSSSVVPPWCGPVHAERKYDSSLVLGAVLWDRLLLVCLNVYAGRLLESILYYGVLSVAS